MNAIKDALTQLSQFAFSYIPLNRFEPWLYQDQVLESIIDNELYLALISADYHLIQEDDNEKYLKLRRLAAQAVKSFDPSLWFSLLNAEIKQLRSEIYTAFEGVSREGGISLNQAYVSDNWIGYLMNYQEIENFDAIAYPSEEEYVAALGPETDTSWQELIGKQINPESINFLDAIGFRYYLPVFLLDVLPSIIDKTYETRGYHSDDCLYHSMDISKHGLKKISLFTRAQLNVIIKFIMLANVGENTEFQEPLYFDEQWERSGNALIFLNAILNGLLTLSR